MGNFKIKSIWESKNTGGGNVPADLTNRLQAVETKASTNETNITNLTTNGATKQELNDKIQQRVINATIGVGTTYVVQAASGYQIISATVARKRTSDNFYFFTHPTVNLNFQFFIKSSDGSFNIYTEGNANGFNNEYRIIVVEKKI